MNHWMRKLGLVLVLFGLSLATGYGLVFKTPLFVRTGWVTDFIQDYSEPIDYSSGIVRKIGGTEEIRNALKTVYSELMGMDEPNLYVLKSLADVCASGGINCVGRPSKDVRPLVEAALDYKQKLEARSISEKSVEAARDGVYASKLSLSVAIAAALISILGFVFRKAL